MSDAQELSDPAATVEALQATNGSLRHDRDELIQQVEALRVERDTAIADKIIAQREATANLVQYARVARERGDVEIKLDAAEGEIAALRAQNERLEKVKAAAGMWLCEYSYGNTSGAGRAYGASIEARRILGQLLDALPAPPASAAPPPPSPGAERPEPT